MKVWQPGGHLMRERGVQVEDWSWAQTKRRLTTLYRLARPYKGRVLLSIVSLLAATAVALAPPFLLGRAVDEVKRGETSKLGWIVVAFVAAGALGIAFAYPHTYYTGWA